MIRDSLIFRAGRRLCSIGLEHVGETMRPLAIESMPKVPQCVAGVSLVRGSPTPVVDLRQLLEEDSSTSPGRLVTLQVGSERRVGLLVDEVLGVRKQDEFAGTGMAPLLQGAGDFVDELATLDGSLVAVLRAARVVPEEVWAHMSADPSGDGREDE